MPPANLELDGHDLSPLLFEGALLPERPFFYYRGDQIFAVRLGEWKAHLKTQTGYGQAKAEVHATPQLYHLGRDPSEKRDLAASHPEVAERLSALAEGQRATVAPGEPQLH
jgi:arylsulfatase A-like enzyme